MTDPLQRRRVERFLSGDQRVADLAGLFLHVRSRCDGRESVEEVGHFIAHQEERTKGFATRSAKDVFSILKFQLTTIGGTVDLSRVNIELPGFLLSTIQRLDSERFKGSGFNRKQAYRLAMSIISKATLIPNSHYSLTDLRTGRLIITDQEFNLFNFILPNAIIRPSFSGDGVFQDFKETLKSNGLLRKDELRDFESGSTFVQLYVLSVMHRSDLLLQQGYTGSLYISLDDGTRSGILTLNLSVEFEVWGRKTKISTPFMSTNLFSTENCEAGLLEAGDGWSSVINRQPPFTPFTVEPKSDIPLDQRLVEVGQTGKLALF